MTGDPLADAFARVFGRPTMVEIGVGQPDPLDLLDPVEPDHDVDAEADDAAARYFGA